MLPTIENARMLGKCLETTLTCSPARVGPGGPGALVGYSALGPEMFEIAVNLLGYYSESLSDFINPRLPPRPGISIHVADAVMLTRVLSKRRDDE